jgi:hypothetical protein
MLLCNYGFLIELQVLITLLITYFLSFVTYCH